MKAVTRIGEYDVNKYVQYIKKNPDVMDTILNLYNSFDLNGMLSLIEDLDLNNPYQKSKLDHKWYMKYKKEIEQALNEDQEFLETSENKYLEDEYTKKIYNKSANKYDEIWDGVFAYELRGEVVDWLEVLPNEKILEIGVGTGNNIKYFPNDVDLIGIDYAGEMLDIAKNKAIQLDKKVKFMQMNAKKLNFKDDSFDKVLCFYSLCSMSAPGNVLREIPSDKRQR